LLVTSVNEHRDILDAIGSRNAVKSAEALRQHVLMSRERTIRNFVKYSERSAP
jgi:DNA-binding GntR family transcriptional regulator